MQGNFGLDCRKGVIFYDLKFGRPHKVKNIQYISSCVRTKDGKEYASWLFSALVEIWMPTEQDSEVDAFSSA
jgi:hypothetical protein